jgi:NAD(P) transhydrogenase subunit alpha
MTLGIPREIHPGERRVAATPETTGRLVKLGFDVLVESGAGLACSFEDDAYRKSGARIAPDAAALWAESDLVLKVQPPELNPKTGIHEADVIKPGATLISFVWPAKNKDLIDRMAKRKATLIAMDQVPRITRAQKIDALSSMANIAGYRAVIEAASFFGRFFTGQMTAAGKVPPARVFVIGAGVAGLAAIGAARGLGAIVRAFDTRPAVREQVQSMGAEFVPLEYEEDGSGAGGYAKEMSPGFIAAEMALIGAQAREVDIIITTALIPGRPAPRLITEEMVASMKPGSVIVDLAAEAGGNCALTQPGTVTVQHNVTIIGYVDLPSRLAPTASQLYGSNLVNLVTDMGGAAGWKVDENDAVVRPALVLKNGELMWPPPAAPAQPTPVAGTPAGAAAAAVAAKPSEAGSTGSPSKSAGGHGASSAKSGNGMLVALALLGAALLGLGAVAPGDFVSHLTVFLLACFVGWQVIWKVTPALHTPLMSVTNAISGIIVIGGMLQLGSSSELVRWLGAAAVLVATINIAGGFLVTQRMLAMFRK